MTISLTTYLLAVTINSLLKYPTIILFAAPTYAAFCVFEKFVAVRLRTRVPEWLPLGMVWLFPEQVQEG